MRDLLSKLDAIVSETELKNPEDLQAKRKALADLEKDPVASSDPEISNAITQKKSDLEQQAKSKDFEESFQIGDAFGISFSEDFEIGTKIVGFLEDGIVVELDDSALEMLTNEGLTFLEGEVVTEEKIKGVDGKACWKGKRYAGKVKKADGTYKDKCVPIGEDHGPEDPKDPVNYGEYDREGDMAKDDLRTIDSAAEELYSILQADDNLPEWVQAKITKAVDYIDTARDYMKAQNYEEGVAEAVGMMIKGAAISGANDQDIADRIAAKTGGRVDSGSYGHHVLITYPTTQHRAAAAVKIRKMFPGIELYKSGGNRNAIDEQGVAEGFFGIDDKIKGKIQNVVSDLSDIPGMWDHKAQTFTDAGMDKLKTVLKNNPKYIKYALNLDYRDYEAEGVAEAGSPAQQAAIAINMKKNHKKPKSEEVDEAKYQGREVPLGKKMAGDVKKSKVYVRKPNGNIVKVNFGDKKMRIKKSNPARRKSFRARHNCANPGPRHKARYWSCRSW